ncbi:hypothetical protein [Flammeovirga sp. EKP202]|uniref:hypothetical protein n=1 Tax=Flammeovirga sp. EKP202 TaxID=2770592 RepID=UPI00199EA549|nr:hypothetical protein [Flammeovirga sp. EKP202]MBD0399848.1 hypothetical protein [Flammeovirga sp. EKP202]
MKAIVSSAKHNFFYYQIIAIILCVSNFFLYSKSFFIGFFFTLLIIVSLKVSMKNKILLAYFMYFVFFQNYFISIFSYNLLINKGLFKFLHGLNILIPVFISILYLLLKKQNKIFVFKIISLVTLLAIYFVFGTYQYGLNPSLAYLRLFLIPIIFFICGLFFQDIEENFVKQQLKIMLFAIVIVGICQFLFPKFTTYLLNELDYFKIKKGVLNLGDLISFHKRNYFLNLSIFPKLVRVSSLIKSMISVSYFITIISLYIYYNENKKVTFLFFVIALFIVSSKGAIILYFTFVLFNKLRESNSYSLTMLIMTLFWLLTIITGYLMHNEHIVGFVAGLKYIFTLGNGLGFSGNLSNVALTSWDGVSLPDLGYWTRFQNGSESVYGVLISSLGILGTVYTYTLYTILEKSRNVLPIEREYIVVLSVLIFFLGIFQEEAFSPYAIGLSMFILGFTLNKK